MSFRFTCPHCNATTDVDDQFAGQVGSCFSCSKEIQLPAANEDSTLAAAILIKEETSHSRNRFLISLLVYASVVLVVGGAIFLLVNMVGSDIGLFGDTSLSRSEKNLKRIATAMRAYHDDYGVLPPPYLSDETGKPAHSWRVLLLPYLDQDFLYQQYRFDEPWNGPTNSMLISQMPSLYGDPTDPSAAGAFETGYMVIVGPKTPFRANKPVNLTEFKDGTGNTILVAEVVSKGTGWTEPVDLDASKMRFLINGTAGVEMGSNHSGGAQIVTADGMVYFLPDTLLANTLESFTTIQGRESGKIASSAKK